LYDSGYDPEAFIPLIIITHMQPRLARLVSRLQNRSAILDDGQRQPVYGETVGIVYGSFLFLIGLAWLVAGTDLQAGQRAWPLLAAMVVLAGALSWRDFYWIVPRSSGSYDRWSAPLNGMVTTSATLVFGPLGVWVGVLVAVIAALRQWSAAVSASQRWNVVRTLCLTLASHTLGSLVGLRVYGSLGGILPLPAIEWRTAFQGVCFVATLLLFDWLCWSVYLVLARWIMPNRTGMLELALFGAFEIVAYVPELFGVLAAAVLVQMGVLAYVLMMVATLLAGELAQRLSEAVEHSNQRTRELSQLDVLGRALIAAPPELEALPVMLAASVPSMFRHEELIIRLLGGPTLFTAPGPPSEQAHAQLAWLEQNPAPHTAAIGQVAPWGGSPLARPLAAVPIMRAQDGSLLGGIVVRFSPTVNDVAAALPALQSLAALIASALARIDDYQRSLAHQRVLHELSMAADIQTSFLPAALPLAPGWELAAALRPAHQTSGDFYDLFELPGGKLGLVIADVTDKGTGAALFMALSRTLLRTYAFEYPDQPAKALKATNKRILSDSHSSMFVTVFYGVLDPHSGSLAYANAGHNPPLLVTGSTISALSTSGIPLGIEEQATWQVRSVDIPVESALVLYTDGVTEAHNARAELFEMARLEATLRAHSRLGAQAVQQAILDAIQAFVGDEPPSDDVTLVVACRTAGNDAS
jgi:serine phosphatase RsbU (regulator of sigma subunit)